MPTSGFSPDIRSKFKSELENSLGNYDLVIVADFGHGLIDNEIASLICKKANYLALNVQTNSANFGFNLVTKFNKADFLLHR